MAMKFIVIALSLLALNAAATSEQSPVSKVVSLLESLSKKLKAELKAEEEMFSKYECWYKASKDSKVGSSQEAQSRVDSLTAHVEDIEAGRIQFTSERTDLDKQIAELTAELDQATNLRNQENADYNAAKGEIEQAISVIGETVAVFQPSAGTVPNLLSVKADLQKVLKFGEGLLSQEENKALADLAAHKSFDYAKYSQMKKSASSVKAPSSTVVDALNKIQQVLQNNLVEISEKEADAQTTFDTLKQSKENMLTQAQSALAASGEEAGVREAQKQAALAEKEALTVQIQQDEQFMTDLEAAHTTKENEWSERKELRMQEQAAISKAIALLQSDEARDTFNRVSYASQVSLLQTSETPCTPKRNSNALPVARSVLSFLALQDSRVGALVQQASSDPNAMSAVASQIDELIAALTAETASDTQRKTQCEADLAAVAQQMRDQSLELDAYTSDITNAEGKLKEIDENIQAQNKAVTDLEKQMKTITDQRAAEAASMLEKRTTDQKAIQLLGDAKLVLSEWMGATTTALLKKKAVLKPIKPVASHMALGAAVKVKQEPAAATEGAPAMSWEGAGYSGSSTQNIVGMLDLIKQDLEHDLTQAETDEATAISEFETQKAALQGSIDAAVEAGQTYLTEKSAYTEEKVTKTQNRASKAAELASTKEQYAGLKPGCDFIMTNFEVRAQKREAEAAGLSEAKQIIMNHINGVLLQKPC